MKYTNPARKLMVIGNIKFFLRTLYEVDFQESSGPIPIKNKRTNPIGTFN